MSVEAAESASLAQPEPDEASPLCISTLGLFALARDGSRVDRREWQSKKARDLLKLLITRRGRPAPRDWLMEALWRGQDPGLLSNRLSVALSTLRGVLDPDHRCAPDYFLSATVATVTLRSNHVEVDVERFLAEGHSALGLVRDGDLDAARPRLEAADAAYLGDFLEEDLYEDWTVPLREEARSLYISVLGELAEIAHAVGRHDAAIRYRLRVLERDRWDEAAHLGVIAALVSARRHGEARRAHRDYARRMHEIGVQPAPLGGVNADHAGRPRSAAA
jgi:DNA-binding SARP family transcriptional activator